MNNWFLLSVTFRLYLLILFGLSGFFDKFLKSAICQEILHLLKRKALNRFRYVRCTSLGSTNVLMVPRTISLWKICNDAKSKLYISSLLKVAVRRCSSRCSSIMWYHDINPQSKWYCMSIQENDSLATLFKH